MLQSADVARFFIMLANQREDDNITNLKLNKLLYYAQGVQLARTGEPLFNEPIEAWRLGPVVPSVYHTYKVCGSNPIPYEDEPIQTKDLNEDELNTLLDVVQEFGQFTGSKLVDMTHEPGTPWEIVYYGKYDKTIPIDLIQAYFTEHPVSQHKPSRKIDTVKILPSDWYDPDEDTEWEAYL